MNVKMKYEKPCSQSDEAGDDMELEDIPDDLSEIRTITEDHRPVMSLYYKQTENKVELAANSVLSVLSLVCR